MPFRIKLGLSAAVALAVLAGWVYMRHLGQVGPGWAVAFLGPFMVVSLWIFPEVMRSRADGRGDARGGGRAPGAPVQRSIQGLPVHPEGRG